MVRIQDILKAAQYIYDRIVEAIINGQTQFLGTYTGAETVYLVTPYPGQLRTNAALDQLKILTVEQCETMMGTFAYPAHIFVLHQTKSSLERTALELLTKDQINGNPMNPMQVVVISTTHHKTRAHEIFSRISLRYPFKRQHIKSIHTLLCQQGDPDIKTNTMLLFSIAFQQTPTANNLAQIELQWGN